MIASRSRQGVAAQAGWAARAAAIASRTSWRVPVGEMADDDVVVDRRADGRLALALALLAADQVEVVGRRAGCGLGEARLVQGVELFVVVAKGGVGDLQARLRVGRHGVSPALGRWRGPATVRGGLVEASVAPGSARRPQRARRRPRPARPPRRRARPRRGAGPRPPRAPASPCLPVRTKTPRRPSRWAARTSLKTSSPTIARSRRRGAGQLGQ